MYDREKKDTSYNFSVTNLFLAIQIEKNIYNDEMRTLYTIKNEENLEITVSLLARVIYTNSISVHIYITLNIVYSAAFPCERYRTRTFYNMKEYL